MLRRELTAIRKRARIIVASSRPQETEIATMNWLKQNFRIKDRFVNTTTSGKAGVQADILIDDSLVNVKTFAEQNKQKLAMLLAQPWNKKTRPIRKLMDDGKIVVAKDWAEITALFSRNHHD